MFYPDNFEEKIGFDTIRQLLTDHCFSEMGREVIRDIHYSDSFDEIQRNLLEINELKEILLLDDPFPAQDYHDLRTVLTRIAIDGTFIELDELAALRNLIAAVINVHVYLRVRHEDGKHPNLWKLCEDVVLEKQLLAAINDLNTN